MNRNTRALIAQDTIDILEKGEYRTSNNRLINISKAIMSSNESTHLYRPEDYNELLNQVDKLSIFGSTHIAVANCTTLAAAYALNDQFKLITCLNFASAFNPGGGFLLGSQAQEESIARSSGLYLTLQGKPEYYEYHRALDSSLYSNHIIYSPNVPIFRDDDGNLLEQPWSSAFITAAAVNAGAVRKNEPNHISDILPTLQERARMVLAIAAVRGSEALVLGAWGCGVFQNDPLEVANIFANLLKESMFENRFARIEFAVFDTSTSKAAYNAFLETFS